MDEDTEKDEGFEIVIDPPSHEGGGDADVSLDGAGEEAKVIDPPSHDGGN